MYFMRNETNYHLFFAFFFKEDHNLRDKTTPLVLEEHAQRDS